MKIEHGKIYKSRAGDLVTVTLDGRGDFPFSGSDGRTYTKNGSYLITGEPSPLDLIEVAPQQPDIALTEITTALGLLDVGTKWALAAHDGPIEEYTETGEWISASKSVWRGDKVYRAAPLTKPSIDWDHVGDEWNWLARDAGGKSWLFKAHPFIRDGYWNGEWIPAEAFTSFTHGTCDWSDSLVMRPGYKGE